MKKQFHLIGLFSLLFVMAISAQSTLRPSGNIVSENFDQNRFTGLDISTDFKAIVTRGKETSVRIECDDNLLPHILVENQGGVLHIRHKQNLNIQGRETLVAHITMPNLISVNGSSDAIIELTNKFDAPIMSIDLRGDSVLDGEINVDNLNVKLRGDSYLTVSGSADKVNADLRGDSEIRNYDFVINELDLDLRGDSVAELTVQHKMNVDLDGDSEMRYKGTPKIMKQSLRGDSEITRMR